MAKWELYGYEGVNLCLKVERDKKHNQLQVSVNAPCVFPRFNSILVWTTFFHVTSIRVVTFTKFDINFFLSLYAHDSRFNLSDQGIN